MKPDAAARDYTSLRETMLELARQRLPEWTDHGAADPGVVLVELMAWMGDQLFYHQERIANESYLPTAQEERNVRDLLALVGVSPRAPREAQGWLSLRFEAAGGQVLSTIPTGASFQADLGGEAVIFRYLGEPVPVRGAERVRVRIPVSQVDLEVSGRSLGISSGKKDQRLALRQPRVLEDSVTLTVGERPWTRVSSLGHSGPRDEHFRVTRGSDGDTWIELGDGACGRIPQRSEGELRVSYRVGGGARGNLAPGRVRKAVTTIPQLAGDEDGVTNLEPMTGGLDAEPLSEAARRAPLLFRARDRAVTGADYEAIARSLGATLALARAGTWNRVEVCALPPGALPGSSGAEDDLFLRALQRELQARAPITVAVDVRPPRWVGLRLSLRVEPAPRRDAGALRSRVQRAIARLYAPGDVPFGARLHLSKVYEAVEALPEVNAVWVQSFARVDRPAAASEGTLALGPTELPYLDPTRLELSVVGEDDV